MPGATIEDLRKVVVLQDLPNEHLQWLVDHSEYHEYSDGELIAKYGDPADIMWFSWEGRVSFYLYVNGRQIHYFTFENTPTTGGVGGLLPYSRMKTYPGNSFAVGEVKAIRLNKKYFQELEALNPDLIQRLIGYMTERARSFATMQLQHEKVNALGNLAAGVAHELNNPAAAISGIAGELDERLNRNYQLTKDLLKCNIPADELQAIHELVGQKQNVKNETKISALKRIEKQDEMEDWLTQNGIQQREIAETFADAGFSINEMESVKNSLGAKPFVQVIPWLENLVSSQKIIKDLGDASGHISRLVASIKSHVHMDRPDDVQLTNVHEGIESTLTLLGFKLREKSIEVIRKFAEDLPMVPAYVGELNQVWSNLVDNAIFAVPNGGTITIETVCDARNVTVCIIDNGPGIPKDIQTKIFDPFFTTKKVGEGTGIGLDIVLRIVNRHEGEIRLDSVPGRTQFSICLPRTQKPA
jgi:signal transduction histidine kinase